MEYHVSKKERKSRSSDNRLSGLLKNINPGTEKMMNDLSVSIDVDISDSLQRPIKYSDSDPINEETIFYTIEKKEKVGNKNLESIKDLLDDYCPEIKDGPYTVTKQIILNNFLFDVNCYYSDPTISNTGCHIIFTKLWIIVLPNHFVSSCRGTPQNKLATKNVTQTGKHSSYVYIDDCKDLKGYVLLPVSRIIDIVKIREKDSELTYQFNCRVNHKFSQTFTDETSWTMIFIIKNHMSKFITYLSKIFENLETLSAWYHKSFYDQMQQTQFTKVDFKEETIRKLSDENYEYSKIDLLEDSQETEINQIVNYVEGRGTLVKDLKSFSSKNKSQSTEKIEISETRKNFPFKVLVDFDDKCQTYPPLVIVPKVMTDSEIQKCMEFREKGRLPVLRYILYENGERKSSLWRSAQCKSGLISTRCIEDEKLIKEIQKMTNSKKGVIYDCRSYLVAYANKINGKGFHCQSNYSDTSVIFGNMPNIHKVRTAHGQLIQKNYDSLNFYNNDSGWINFLQLIQIGVKNIVEIMQKGEFVMVNCSCGWDRTPQLVSLTKIVMNPYYRTFEGFKILVNVEWISFGHRFNHRLIKDKNDDNELSPVFIQFLDALRVIISQNLDCFEYNDQFQKDLGDAYIDGRFSRFIHDSAKDIKNNNKEYQLLNMWVWMSLQKKYHHNPFYEQQVSEMRKILSFDVHAYCIDIWSDFHRGDIKYCLKYSTWDKKQHEKKMSNQLLNRKLQNLDSEELLISMAEMDNFIKV